MFRLIVFSSLLLVSELSAQDDILLNFTSYDSARLPVLKNENAMLEREKANLVFECQTNIDYWTKLYNDTYNGLKHDLPDVVNLEKELSEALAKEAALDRSEQELSVSLDLLKLKKRTLINTIGLLKKHESHKQSCIDYANYIGFKHVFVETKPSTFSARSRSTDRRGSQGNVKTYVIRQTQLNQNVKTERDNILMAIKVQQEGFKNTELKEYIKYHTSFCERKVDHLKNLIESLKKWPQAVGLQPEIIEEIRKLNGSIAFKKNDVLKKRDQLEALVAELRKLQDEFDSRRDVEECVTQLNRWPLNDALVSLKDNLQEVLNFRPNMEDRYHLAIEGIIDKYIPRGLGSRSANSSTEHRHPSFKLVELAYDKTIEDKTLEDVPSGEETFRESLD